jgi:hypothetical protein
MVAVTGDAAAHDARSKIDPRTGLAIPQPLVPLKPMAAVGLYRPKVNALGAITYRCHTCGESIINPSEVLFVDDRAGRDFASHIVPGKVSPTTTTHHDWHMQSQQREDA